MIFKLLLAIVPVAVVLALSEFLWRRKIIKGERARKFIHIIAGVWMAFWPLYLPFDGIFLLGICALVLLLYSRFTNLFHAIYAVKRRTYGELFYAVAIVSCSYIGKEAWIYVTSILLLALADGGAAVIGRIWGVSNQYKVFRSKNLIKSVSGTAAFMILAYLSVGIGLLLAGGYDDVGHGALLFTVPLVLTVIENISPYGLDNLITPLFATLVLNSIV